LRKLLFLFFLLIGLLKADTLVVDNDPTCAFGECWSCKAGLLPDNPYSTIQEAINNAKDEDTIEICPGTYNEANLEINKNIQLIGLGDTPSDVYVYTNSNNPIFYTDGWRNGVKIENMRIEQKKNNKIALKIGEGTNIDLNNLEIVSKGYGIYFTGNIQNSTVENSEINASARKDCIYDYNTSGKMDFLNLQLNNCKKGIHFINDSSGDFNFSNIIFNNMQEYGVDASRITISNSIYIEKCKLDGKNQTQKAFYFKEIKGKIDFIDNNVSNVTEYGLRVNNVDNPGVIKNNIFSNCGKKCLYLLKSKLWRSYEVNNNCFYGSDNTTYAFNRDENANFDGNYWQYLNDGDKFEIPDIPKYDNSPLSSCPNNQTNTLQECFFDDFSSNDIGSIWKIIKADNYTPNIQNGQLYLTDNGDDISSGVSLIGKFPAKDNYVVIEFEENAYDDQGGEGADGVAVVFSDASVEPKAGAFGGSLGYAQKTYGNSDCTDSSGCPGFAGGWLGIGLDEYGNFSNPTEGRVGGPGRTPDSVAIRGKGDGTSGYKYIDGTDTLSPGIDDNRYNDNESRNWYTSRSPLHYKYKIILDTRNNKTLIKIYRDTGNGYQLILDTDASSNGEPPEYFKFSLTGSTGGANNYHTFDNIKISALNCGTLGQEETKNYKFDVWNIDHDISDRNITTKIVGNLFKLTLAEANETDYNDDFNGTVCTSLFDENTKQKISDWNATYWKAGDDINKTDISFKVSKAVKKAKVYIYWIENVKESNDSCQGLFTHEGNESNSTDDFAIRPKCYHISITPNPFYAGSGFDINVSTDSKSDEYNGTADIEANITDTTKTCVHQNADFNLSSITFDNGESNNTAKFDDVGIVDINITDKTWAEVDNYDTPKKCDEEGNGTYICVCQSDINKLENIEIVPHHFEINATFENNDTENNFTYYDADLNMSAHLDLNITPKNENNITTQNYNDECYAKDIDINISHNDVDVNVSKIVFKYIDVGKNVYELNVSKDSNISFMLGESNFTKAKNETAHVDVFINFDKNISNPVNPFELNITKIDVNDTDSNGTLNLNETARYYYGNLLLDDILAVQDDFNKTYSFVVYDDNESDTLKPNSKEIAFNWYANIYHRNIDGNVSSGEIVVSRDYNASHNINDSTEKVSVSFSQDNNGHITFEINRKDSSVNFAVIHLLSPNLKWLWYSKFGDEYNISNNSTCLNHFCFTVTWQKTNDVGEVGSGSFAGTESNITDSNATKRGVKIFR
jgi:hypothetical protein